MDFTGRNITMEKKCQKTRLVTFSSRINYSEFPEFDNWKLKTIRAKFIEISRTTFSNVSPFMIQIRKTPLRLPQSQVVSGLEVHTVTIFDSKTYAKCLELDPTGRFNRSSVFRLQKSRISASRIPSRFRSIFENWQKFIPPVHGFANSSPFFITIVLLFCTNSTCE